MIIALTTEDVLKATGGKALCGDASANFSAVGIDSRVVKAGHLFVAIKGENHDGHAFIPEVIGQGVQGVVMDQAKADKLQGVRADNPDLTWVAVQNTIRALGDLAAYQRSRGKANVVGITGSNGKTTTRRLVATIFEGQFDTLASRGSYNNNIGLPLTLLKLGPQHQWVVLEMGMNHFGEIRRLSAICRPNIGVITNIGPCHLEGVGSIEGVLKAKAEILENIESGGAIILNRDDPYLARLGTKTDKKVLFFGESKKADIRGHSIEETDQHIDFTLRMPESQVRVNLPAAGRFMVHNALAAAAAGYAAGLSGEAIQMGLARFRPVSGRMNIITTDRDVTIVDDTYNANPGSMAAAIRTLATLAGSDRSILVVGDMLELGDNTDRLHYEIGELAGRTAISRLYATGPHAPFVAKGALAGGMARGNVFTGEKEAIIETLKKELKAGDRLLVKGSRGSAMEKIVEPIKQWAFYSSDENEDRDKQIEALR